MLKKKATTGGIGLRPKWERSRKRWENFFFYALWGGKNPGWRNEVVPPIQKGLAPKETKPQRGNSHEKGKARPP